MIEETLTKLQKYTKNLFHHEDVSLLKMRFNLQAFVQLDMQKLRSYPQDQWIDELLLYFQLQDTNYG